MVNGAAQDQKSRVMGIRFRVAGPVVYCEPTEPTLCIGDRVVVQTDAGLRYPQSRLFTGTPCSPSSQWCVRLRRTTALNENVWESEKKQRWWMQSVHPGVLACP